MIPMIPIGTLIRKIQCQVKNVVTNPPIGGPTSGPISAGMDNHAIAEMSWLRGVARTRTRRPTGVIIAPPMPCRNRAPTNSVSDEETAQATEPTTKTPMATRKTRLAPKRSAIQPETGMKTARATK
jgi:hypothetical protein